MSYENFEDKVKEIHILGDAQGVLSWDQEVMMPEKGIQARSLQNSVLSKVRHQKITSEELESYIEELSEEKLDEDQSAVLREVRRSHERAKKVPESLTEKISKKSSENVESWKKAREEDDFEIFAQSLQEMVELKREYAEHIDPDKEAYKVLFEDYEPYISFERVEQVIDQLKSELPEMLEKLENADKELDTSPLEVELSDEKNMELARKAAELIGFDFEHGRVDTSTHPFTSGNQFDTRITTRFQDDSVAENIAITMHETGHALYNLGVPQEEYGTPLGEPRELSVHESQSRLWENHVGRSKSFWNYFVKEMEEVSGKFEDVEPEECYEAVNSIDFDNKIRTEADELSYHLHIALRFELGRKLINGDIEVEELPGLWNQRMEELLNVEVESASEGVLQDIHWGWGNFGYFPTYTMGTVLAAQLYNTAENELDSLEEGFENGEFKPLLGWLRENIHSEGQRLETDELIENVTGEALTADYFIEYVKEKYGTLYNVEL
ncbi:carboxypeptidase M32 [Candidatus Nanohalococcus occultus]|uniref:Metal-dependent carboxypeptidase n=1 Tax=Candidatus Nanohalococcus occultus TaxID=2978047 RepID=A0ABY8CEA2_9ARCH|nr:Zn-dependent carboxypeptidase, M32 family [Candidatus Nanohaloarchaeota archaeon SVXNc]